MDAIQDAKYRAESVDVHGGDVENMNTLQSMSSMHNSQNSQREELADPKEKVPHIQLSLALSKEIRICDGDCYGYLHFLSPVFRSRHCPERYWRRTPRFRNAMRWFDAIVMLWRLVNSTTLL